MPECSPAAGERWQHRRYLGVDDQPLEVEIVSRVSYPLNLISLNIKLASGEVITVDQNNFLGNYRLVSGRPSTGPTEWDRLQADD